MNSIEKDKTNEINVLELDSCVEHLTSVLNRIWELLLEYKEFINTVKKGRHYQILVQKGTKFKRLYCKRKRRWIFKPKHK